MDEVNLIILVCAGLVLASVFTSVVAFRAGAPLLLVFLGLGLAVGAEGPGGLVFTDTRGAFLLGSAALALILFDSGFHTSLRSFRRAALPATTLATLGVAATATLLGLPAHFLLGLGWGPALLLGTILSSTDAAALFLLLRVGGITIRDHVRSTLEVESGLNDPAAAFLALITVALLTGQRSGDWLDLTQSLLVLLGGGILGGVLGGLAIVVMVNRLRLEPGLYPVLVMGLALAVYALVNLLGGSGFLAAYLAGLVAGNAPLQWGGALRRFLDGIIWLAQIIMFLTLGLLARPDQFPTVIATGGLLAAILIFVARPVAVFVLLTPFRFGWRDRLFISWVGLRGAVSILLALLPILGGLPEGEKLFHITFLVVVASLFVQGWTVRPLARWLGLLVPEEAGPVDRMEVDLPGLADRELVAYVLDPASAVAQGRPLPRWARPLLVRRGGKVRSAPRRLLGGDRVYLLAAPHQVPLLDKLFGRARHTDEASLYGDFAIAPDVTLGALRATYDLPPTGGEDGLPVSELFRREFRNDLEVGDRVRLGPVDLVLREIRDGQIAAIGISLDPTAKPLHGWERFAAKLALRLGGPSRL